MNIYTTKQVTVQAFQRDGIDDSPLIGFIPAEYIGEGPAEGPLPIMNQGGSWVVTYPSWWICLDENGKVSIFSPSLFLHTFQPAVQ